ncbi:molybdopterin-guanine dinucleotide biosynthesis protein B [Clostridium taeniosporum]|uniref:Molybdopterin-guanine dinucleotide biosynthesis protein B n=1 Tax=Clostridium taeniosporum TaxID=394958 RepID=A0A1D7XN53_9CLOT|nr:molybdopterin-guanine dinucleotide biosynthesis protein B [Clostridium taeniosporum]AOR24768.1 molybdopterin-guanine dinucleotide biosynthesis protein B [Clostridium taeniosporum]
MENLYLENNKPFVISIVATKSGTGKTTLIEQLIKIFKLRKYKVGVLKHDAHKFEIDKEGKDSYKFSKAGADNVIISSNEKLAMIQIQKEEKNIEDIIKFFENIDIVIVEGFKSNKYPKIEVYRKEIDNKLLYEDMNFNKETFLAVASNEKLNLDIPILDLNDAYSIANFIEQKIFNKTDKKENYTDLLLSKCN